MKEKLSHIDKKGNPTMVDVGDKKTTKRMAKAKTVMILPDSIIKLLSNDEIITKKGPVFHTAIIAGTMAAKNTSTLIPFCHPLPIENCKIDISTKGNSVVIISEVGLSGKTGVEMEALTATSVAALTIYDMCKAISSNIIIKETKLIQKTGGKKDYHAS